MQIRGNGPSRPVSLKKTRVLACEMTELLLPHREPLPISKIRPAYEEKFKKGFIITDYGYPKLIKALEAIPDILYVSCALERVKLSLFLDLFRSVAVVLLVQPL